jgi:hypothetical protein
MSIYGPIHFKREYIAGTHTFTTIGNGDSNLSLNNLVQGEINNTLIIKNSNVGISTNPLEKLHIYGNASYIAGNIGIGTTIPKQSLDIQNGHCIISEKIGINSANPFYEIDIIGEMRLSGNINFPTRQSIALETDSTQSSYSYIRRNNENIGFNFIDFQGLQLLNTQAFSNVGTATYFPYPNAQIILAGCLGGGGGGGGANSTSAGFAAGGGQGGGFGASFINVSELDVSGTIVTVGDGGAGGIGTSVANAYAPGSSGNSSSFGSFVSATGGAGAVAAATTQWSGGFGGRGSFNADISICGGDQRRTSAVTAGGAGGYSPFSQGGAMQTTAGNGNAAADNSGAGGGGARLTGTSSFNGGKGGSGLVKIYEFGARETIIGNLFSFSDFTFTNAGATLQNGPTLAQCKSAYAGTGWLNDYFRLYNDIQGYQQWTVPRTSKYFIMAAGAVGGNNAGRFGGMGSIVFTTTTLNSAEKLIIIVGQEGQNGSGATTTYTAGGGGGGSFVVRSNNTNYPLIAAGGGGGAGNTTTSGHGRIYINGQTTKSTDAYPILITNTSTASTAGISYTSNNAGAGFSENAGKSPQDARSFADGFIGGLITQTSNGAYGGFGGGGAGASNMGANIPTYVGGGGGGWSGGNVSGTTGDGGYIASSNFCADTFTGHIWHNMYKSTNGSGDGLVYIKEFIPYTSNTFKITFTSCDIFNGLGPTYNQMVSYYSSMNCNIITNYLFNYLGYDGLQSWLVPKTGTYNITAVGANGQSHTDGGVGGKGGVISAQFNLTEGEPLLIVVGQCRSGTVTSTTAGAGGGASWVYRFFNGPIYYPSPPTPLIGAGGGGGAYSISSGSDVNTADTIGTAASATTNLGGGASFYINSARSYGFFGHMENAANKTNAYKYPFTSLDFTNGAFGGGGRSIVGNTTTGGGAGWRAGGVGAAVGAPAGTCWSSNITYTYTGATNPRADGNGEVTIELLY